MKLPTEQIKGSSAHGQAALTPRQDEIRLMLRQGMSNKAIATSLGISEGTVKNHISEIFRVLNATNRTQVAQQGRQVMFDADEYLHLALHASSVGNHHACMTYLKELLQQQPAHAFAIHLLATQHAELGLYERAIKGMTAALAINPQLQIARFQLGMLLLDRQRATEAKQQFAMLADTQDPALRLYCRALTALADGNAPLASERLTSGLACKQANPAMASQMRRVLELLSRNGEATGDELGGAERPLSLGAYRQTPG
jgi:DNA-binding CsgD family transcriptional regulator